MFIILLFIASVQFARTIIIDTPLAIEEQNTSTLYENESEDSYVDQLAKFRIEMVKFQIRERINELDARSSAERTSEISKDIKRFFMKEEDRQQEQDPQFSSEEAKIIHAKKNNMTCLYSNTTYCRMHHFELGQSLTASSVDLWLYKRTKHPEWISIVLTSSTSSGEKPYETLYYETHAQGWNKLELPNPSSWNESSYMIEISGDTIEYIGELSPFLLVSKLTFTNRQRREVTCETNENCCLLPLRISFSEMGFDSVVLPNEFEANMCVGKCNRDPSSVRTHYERAIVKVLENNNSVKIPLGECWTLSCKPKQLEGVRVLYNGSDGKIHDLVITDLSIKSCDCS